jgi:hypothetical protein
MKNGKLSLVKGNENILLVDSETVNDNKIMVDFSGVVVNSNLIKKTSFSFIIKEVWENTELMQGKYASAEKIEIWKKQIENGTKKVVSIYQLIKFVNNLIKENDIKIFCAYNVGFDKSAYKNTLEYFNCYERANKIQFLKVIDIWKVVETFVNRDRYVRYCLKNKFLTAKGNCKTSAEIVYKYLSEELHFLETHIANEDIEIELDILRACAIRNHTFELGKKQFGFSICKLLQDKMLRLS